MRVIEKKIFSKYFEAIKSGEKTFELRKDENSWCVGDILKLKECDDNGKFTNRILNCEITYVLRDVSEYGLMSGYCILAIKVI